MGLSNRDEMYTSLSGDVRGIFSESLKLIHPAVKEEMRNTQTDTHTDTHTDTQKEHVLTIRI